MKWRHGDAQAVEAFYDLLEDSLPLVDERAVPLAELRVRHGRLQANLAGVPAEGQAWAGRSRRRRDNRRVPKVQNRRLARSAVMSTQDEGTARRLAQAAAGELRTALEAMRLRGSS